MTAYTFLFEIDFSSHAIEEALFAWTCVSLQSYHDPESEEEDAHHVSEIVAGASVTSSYTASQLEEEKDTRSDEVEREKVEEEDLPEQPLPVKERPKEGNNVIVKVL